MKTSSGICQSDTTAKVYVNRWHVLSLINDAEQGDIYRAELDTLAMMYADLHRKSMLQDSVMYEQKKALKLCHDGWDDCENMVVMQRKDMEQYKEQQKNIKNIGKAVILALVAALILK